MTTPAAPDPDNRRSRMLCYVAAAVFAACGVGLALLPSLSAPVRGVLAGFHGIVALAVVLYGRSLR